jgi:hypothetical protein
MPFEIISQDVIRDILESNGTLNHVKARLRAEVFAALQVPFTAPFAVLHCCIIHSILGR